MAWIKIDHVTPDKPEIVAIADALRIDQDAAFGKCVRIWIWADQQSVDGDDLPVTPSFIDRLANCPGFADCLVKIGWLKKRHDRLSIPHFDRHNGQTAKNRALSSVRVKRLRNGQSVTQSLPEKEKEYTPIVPKDRKELFDQARKAHPGLKRGIDPEFENFLGKYKGRMDEILPLLLPAAQAYARRCREAGTEKRYIKHFKTWINGQCWTEEEPAHAGLAKPQPVDDGYIPDSLLEDA